MDPPTDETQADIDWGFKEWFLLGAVAGLAYSLFRYPQVFGCLLLVILVFGVLIVYFYWTYVSLVIVGLGVAWLVGRRLSGTDGR
jgi:hypothetical protein